MKPERAADMLLGLWIVGWMDERCAVSSLMIGSTYDFEDVDCVREYARYVVSGQWTTNFEGRREVLYR